jgi:hypothetical protein
MDGDSEGEGAPRTARVARWSTATVVDGTPDGDGTRDCAPADGSEEENSEQLPRTRTSTRALRRPGTRPGPTDEALALAEVRGTGALLRLALERIHKVTAGVDAKLGKGGIKQVVETPLDAEELENLKVAAEAVRAKQADVENL